MRHVRSSTVSSQSLGVGGRYLHVRPLSGCRPWLSGAFGLELTEAMQAIQNTKDASHRLLSKEVDNIWVDLGRDPDDELDPMKLLREASCVACAATWALVCNKPIACAATVPHECCEAYVTRFLPACPFENLNHCGGPGALTHIGA